MGSRPIFAVAALAAVIATPAAAQDAALTADLRCLIVAAYQAGTGQQAAVTSAIYFLGKLDGRAPSLDLEAAVRTEAVKMSATDMSTEAQRCGHELMSRGHAMQAIGDNLSALGKAPASK